MKRNKMKNDKIIIIRIYAKDRLIVGRKTSGESPQRILIREDMRIPMFDTPNLDESQV